MGRPKLATAISPYVRSARGARGYEHHRVVGRPLPASAHVHHVDGDGRNNARRNLVVCQDAKYHNLLHARQRVRDRGGDPNAEAWCYHCQTLRPLTLFWVRKTGYKAGRPAPGCKLCANDRWKARKRCHQP